jgi:glycosyltransferase involved in cell wall biosynthesis
MRVLQLSSDDFSGGAQRAAYRLHGALLHHELDSRMRVLVRQTANDRVISGQAARDFAEKLTRRAQRLLHDYRLRQFKTDNLIMHTFGQESAGLVDELNRDPADVLNLHWISQLLSIKDIGRLTKPLVWTFHDMWAFCGGEHVVADHAASRFRTGYLADNRPARESGPDLNRAAWDAKRAAWARKKISVVAPSRWMAQCARESVLFRDAPIHVIPNPLEMRHLWRPLPKNFAKAALGLDVNKQFILAGSAGGMPHLKGEDLLREALGQVVSQSKPIELLIFGQYQPASNVNWPCPVHWLGPVRDDHVLATIYASADVMVVPSRQDNLPNTAVEAQACGIPVAAFSIGGLPDIVEHQRTGWLAAAFDTADLANGIAWILEDDQRRASLSSAARTRALATYADDVVAAQYKTVYQQAIHGWVA